MDLHDYQISYSIAVHEGLKWDLLIIGLYNSPSSPPNPDDGSVLFTCSLMFPGSAGKNWIPYVAKIFKRILKQGLIIVSLRGSLLPNLAKLFF